MFRRTPYQLGRRAMIRTYESTLPGGVIGNQNGSAAKPWFCGRPVFFITNQNICRFISLARYSSIFNPPTLLPLTSRAGP